jgi:hypothetical protein
MTHRNMHRFVAAAAIAAAVFGFAADASAQVRAVVLDFRGPGAARIRTQAVRSLQNQVELVRSADFEDAAGSMSSDDDYAAGAAATGARAILEGTVARAGRRRFSATIVLRGGDGAVIREIEVSGRNANQLGAQVRRQVWRELGDDIEGAPEPASAGPTEVEDPEDEGGGGGTATGGGGAGRAMGTVVVVDFDGPGADRAREVVIEALESAGLEVYAGSGTTADEMVAVAADREARAVIAGSVSRDGRELSTSVTVYNGADGELLGEARFEGRSASAMLDQIRDNAWAELEGSIEEGRAPGGDGGDADEPSGPSGPRPSAFSLGIYLRLFNRSFSYNDDLAIVRPETAAMGAGLREYSLPLGPAFEVEGTWYPLAHFMGGIPANIGIDGTLVYAFAIESTSCEGPRDGEGNCPEMSVKTFPTSSVAWSLGGRFRIPFDEHEGYFQLAYGTQSFRIEAIDVMNPAPDVPDVDYGFLRAGLGGRFVLGPVSVEPRFAFLLMLGTGQLEEDAWFPNSGGAGMEAMLRLGVAILPFLELQASFNYQRFGFSLDPADDAALNRVAGGALDQYISGSFGAMFRLPGSRAEAGYVE